MYIPDMIISCFLMKKWSGVAGILILNQCSNICNEMKGLTGFMFKGSRGCHLLWLKQVFSTISHDILILIQCVCGLDRWTSTWAENRWIIEFQRLMVHTPSFYLSSLGDCPETHPGSLTSSVSWRTEG